MKSPIFLHYHNPYLSEDDFLKIEPYMSMSGSGKPRYLSGTGNPLEPNESFSPFTKRLHTGKVFELFLRVDTGLSCLLFVYFFTCCSCILGGRANGKFTKK